MSGENRPEVPFSAIKASLKRAAGALRNAGIPFMLGGGLAVWARGGPDTDHDLDLMLRPEDAERALQVLEAEGMRPERPPEHWLFKAYDGDVLIDLIFEPSGLRIDDGVFARADELDVYAVRMLVMPIEDVLVTKLRAMGEHQLDYEGVLEVARILREQIDWDDVRRRTSDSPYAGAFFKLVEELGVVEPQAGNSPVAALSSRRRSAEGSGSDAVGPNAKVVEPSPPADVSPIDAAIRRLSSRQP